MSYYISHLFLTPISHYVRLPPHPLSLSHHLVLATTSLPNAHYHAPPSPSATRHRKAKRNPPTATDQSPRTRPRNPPASPRPPDLGSHQRQAGRRQAGNVRPQAGNVRPQARRQHPIRARCASCRIPWPTPLLGRLTSHLRDSGSRPPALAGPRTGRWARRPARGRRASLLRGRRAPGAGFARPARAGSVWRKGLICWVKGVRSASMARKTVGSARFSVGRNPTLGDRHLRIRQADVTWRRRKTPSGQQLAENTRVIGRGPGSGSETAIRDNAIIAFSPWFTRQSLSHIAQASVIASVF